MPREIQTITANISGPVRHDTMEGREFLVAPMTMIVEGVLNGSNGPLLYKGEEIAKDVGMWNYKPVVVYHPKINGEGVSALSSPAVLTNHKVGVIMNAKASTAKVGEKDVPALKAEAWLESDRMEAVDSRVSDAIENNKMMELSTGLRVDFEGEPGVFNGKDYEAEARNFRPDHLALLPDLVGASSIADGAGLLQLNELSHGDIRSLLNSALRVGKENAWIEDVFEGYFVYEDGGNFFKQNYSDEDNDVEILGTPVEVFKVIEYRTATGAVVSNKKGNEMKKKSKIVDELISNELTSFDEECREKLMGTDREVLVNFSVALIKLVKNEETEETEEHKQEVVNAAKKGAAGVEVSETTNETVAENEEKKPQTAKEFLSGAPPEIKNMLQNGLNSYEKEKTRLIGIVLANKKNTFSKEQLEVKDVTELGSLAALAAGTEQPVNHPLNYGGQQEVTENQEEDEEEPMETPTMNFKDEAKKQKTA